MTAPLVAAARPEQMDNAGSAGGSDPAAGAPNMRSARSEPVYAACVANRQAMRTGSSDAAAAGPRASIPVDLTTEDPFDGGQRAAMELCGSVIEQCCPAHELGVQVVAGVLSGVMSYLQAVAGVDRTADLCERFTQAAREARAAEAAVSLERRH